MQHDDIRACFPILVSDKHPVPLVYLDSGASSQKPQTVLDAMTTFTTEKYANVHRGIHRLSQEATFIFEQARDTLASFIGANTSDELIFVRGLTEGMNMLAHTFGDMTVQKGQTILLSQMEHHSNMIPWMDLAKKKQANLEYIRVTPDGEIDLHDLDNKLKQNDVAIVSVTHISNVLGTINPIEEIIRIAKQYNVFVIVDGAQAAPHIPIDVKKLGCDFYAFTGHKMYGPTGTGIVWGKYEHLQKMPIYHSGGEMVEEVFFDHYTIKEPPAKFEAGTPNISGCIGLAEAARFIESIGFNKIAQIEGDVSRYCLQKLNEVDRVQILGTPNQKIGIYSFTVQGCSPHDIATLMDQEGVAVRVGHHCAQPLHDMWNIDGSIRVSLGIYNQKEDIDVMIGSLEKAIKMLV